MADAFYKMDFRAWNMGTVDLSLECEAAFLRLCHAMYDVAGPIPNSTRMLAGLFRCHQNKAAKLLRELIEAGKIVLTEGGQLFNKRVGQELHTRETLRTHRAHAGHTGGTRSGDARRNPLKTNEQAEAFASTLRTRGEEIREEAPNGAAPAPTHTQAQAPTRPREAPATGDKAEEFERRVRAAAPGLNAAYARAPGLFDLSPVHRWLAAGYDLEADILPPVLAWFAKGPRNMPRSWAYFEPMVTEAATKRAEMPAKPAEPEINVRRGPNTPFDDQGRPTGAKHVFVAEGPVYCPQNLRLASAPEAVMIFVRGLKQLAKDGTWERRLLGPRPDEDGHYIPALAFDKAKERDLTPAELDAIFARQDSAEPTFSARR